MKLFNETNSISEMWEENKENNKEETKKPATNIKRSKSKIAVVYENTFYNNAKLDSVKKNILGSLKGKRKITPTSPTSPTPQQSSSVENVTTDANPSVLVGDTDSVDVQSKMPAIKPCLQRGKSDPRPNRNARRHTEYGISALNCRTEFKIPGEFLFCSHFEHNNTFASVYRKISSASNLRRSLSTGTIGRAEPNKSDIDISAVSSRSAHASISEEEKTSESCVSRRNSCVLRSTCEKMYTKTDVEEKAMKRQSREILADELQSIIDKKDDDSSKATPPRHKSDRETTLAASKSSSDKKDDNFLKVHEQIPGNIPGNTRTNRRSQSCKAAQKRNSHLFNISKYLRDRNTQRSKSFATIREFSTHDAKKRNSLYVDNNNKTESRKSVSNIRDDEQDSDEQCIIADGVKRYLSKDVELTPVKTTRSFDINHTDSRGNSCLHHASSKGDTSTIKYLLEQGGDVWVKNDDHRLPIDLAHNFQTAKLLSSATLFYSEQNEQRNERNVMQTSKLNIAL